MNETSYAKEWIKGTLPRKKGEYGHNPSTCKCWE